MLLILKCHYFREFYQLHPSSIYSHCFISLGLRMLSINFKQIHKTFDTSLNYIAGTADLFILSHLKTEIILRTALNVVTDISSAFKVLFNQKEYFFVNTVLQNNCFPLAWETPQNVVCSASHFNTVLLNDLCQEANLHLEGNIITSSLLSPTKHLDKF